MATIRTQLKHASIGSKVSFFSFMDLQILKLQQNGQLGTAQNYLCTRKSFSHFLQKDELCFSAITKELIVSYEIWLKKKGVSRNSISFYMRILRAVFNKAVENMLTMEASPFDKVYTGIDKTPKRAIDEKIITRLKKLDLTTCPVLSYARDLFLFSFYTRGMAFVDMAYLQKNNIKVGFLHYTRRKTGQPMSIRLEHCMQEIIDRYTPKTLNTGYLLPILTEYEEHKAYKQYLNMLSYYNKLLKRLSGLLELDIPLTSYVSRHTWATTARNKNIPLAIISAGMGHSSETITQIYLASFDTAIIDEANQLIISG